MNELIMSFRSLFKKGRSNGIKILSLGVGLAIGLVLISKVFFEYTYDDFFPDVDRIYRISSSFKMADDDEASDFPQTSGAIAVGMKNEIPEVEVGTRFTYFGKNTFKTPDKKKYSGLFVFADTCLFDVFPLPVLAGDVKDVLSRPMYVMISETIAKNMGGISEAIGQTFEVEVAPGNSFVVGGVFKDMPLNTHLWRYDIIISMVSMSRFMWDGTENWMGNDRYISYVKLYPGTNPDDLVIPMRQMQERHQPLDELEKAGIDIRYTLNPVDKIHSSDEETKRMTILLALLAFAMIFTAVLNYILVALSALVSRTKEMAVYKSYGASEKDIMRKMLVETAVHLFIGIILAIFLIYLFRAKVEDLLGVSVSALFTMRTLIYSFLVCFFVFLISGFIPSWLYARIPVAAAFRSFKETRKNWKLGSLLLQFVATTFLVTLLFVIWKQYNLMLNDDPGYKFDKLLYYNTKGISSEERQRTIDELSRLPIVEGVSAFSQLPFGGASGNNVSLPDDDRELFNMADQYYADKNYLNLLEVPVVEGKAFDPEISTNKSMLVNESFAEKLNMLTGWTDGIVGKDILVSEHGLCRIQGIYRDYRIGSLITSDTRPAALFYGSPTGGTYQMIKLHEMNPENIQEISELMERLFPEREIILSVYHNEVVKQYDSARKFRDSVIIGGVMTLIISIIGLIGYLKDEINRRRSEVAVRKINGANISDIISLFLQDISKIALPALILGGIIARIAAAKWQENYLIKADLNFLLFVGCAFIVLCIILVVIISSTWTTAKDNPVNSLKSE